MTAEVIQLEQPTEPAHARLSASGAHRWMRCAGSLQLEEQFPESTSAYAEEGTRAHDLAEKCLTSGHSASNFVDYPAEMQRYVQDFVDYVWSEVGPGVHMLVEQRAGSTTSCETSR